MNNLLAIIACLKQEELYIKEWLDWHIKCGIDHFYLCDNNDSNYSPKLQNVIQDYINKGIVTIFDYNDIFPVQPKCYTDIYDKIGNKYDWILIIDIDEFICLPKYNNQIKEYLKEVPEDIKCIGINWRYYGDNDLIEYDDRPVQERFKRPVNIYHHEKPHVINGQSRIVKSVIRGKQYFDYDRKIFHQHCAVNKYYTDVKENFYDVLFNKIDPLTQNNLSENELLNSNSKYFNELYNTFYIKHFFTKTIEEYIWKINRGVAVNNYEYTSFFGLNNKTKEKEKFIENYYKNMK